MDRLKTFTLHHKQILLCNLKNKKYQTFWTQRLQMKRIRYLMLVTSCSGTSYITVSLSNNASTDFYNTWCSLSPNPNCSSVQLNECNLQCLTSKVNKIYAYLLCLKHDEFDNNNIDIIIYRRVSVYTSDLQRKKNKEYLSNVERTNILFHTHNLTHGHKYAYVHYCLVAWRNFTGKKNTDPNFSISSGLISTEIMERCNLIRTSVFWAA